jgi:hypothetical protein
MNRSEPRRRGTAQQRRPRPPMPCGAARALAVALLLAAGHAGQFAAQGQAADAMAADPVPWQTLARQMRPATGVGYYAYVKHRKPPGTKLFPCPAIPAGGNPPPGEYLMQIVLVPSVEAFTQPPYAALMVHWGAIRARLTYVEKDGTTKLQQRDPLVEPIAGSLSNWNLKVGLDENIWGRDANDAHSFHSHALPFLMPLLTKVGAASDYDSKETQEVALLRALCGENGIKVVDYRNVGEVELYRLHRLLAAEDDEITALDALPWLRVFLDPGADPASERPDLAGLLALTQGDGGFVRSQYLHGKPSAVHALLFQAFRQEAQAKVPKPPAEPAPMPSARERQDLVEAAAKSACAGLAGTDKYEDCWKTTVAPGVWNKRESAGCNDKPDPKACLTAWAATAAAAEFAAYRAALEAAQAAAGAEQEDDEAQGKPRLASTMWLLPIALALLAVVVWRLDQRRTAAEREKRKAPAVPYGHLDPGRADGNRGLLNPVLGWVKRKEEERTEHQARRDADDAPHREQRSATGSPAGAGGDTPFDGLAGHTAPASEQATRLDGLERQIAHVAEQAAQFSALLDRLRHESLSAKPKLDGLERQIAHVADQLAKLNARLDRDEGASANRGAASDAAFEAAVAAAVERVTDALRREFVRPDDLNKAINQTKQEAKQWTVIQKKVDALEALSEKLGEYVKKLNERLKHVESKSPSRGSAPRAPTKPELDDLLHTLDDPIRWDGNWQSGAPAQRGPEDSAAPAATPSAPAAEEASIGAVISRFERLLGRIDDTHGEDEPGGQDR